MTHETKTVLGCVLTLGELRQRPRISVAPTLGTAWRVVLLEPCQGGSRIAYTLQWGLRDEDAALKRAKEWRRQWRSARTLLSHLDEATRDATRRLSPPNGVTP